MATVDDGVRLWVDGKLVLDKWFDQAPTTYRVDVPMDQGDHLIRMEYYENTGGAVAKLKGYSICPSTFRAEYYANATLSGSPADVVCDPNGYAGTVDYNWGNGGPAELAPRVDNFSAIWTGAYLFQAASYTFTATADDGVRVFLDNKILLDQWRDQAPTTVSRAIWVPAGYHTVRMEYYEHLGGAVAKLSWARTYRAEVVVDDKSSGFAKGGSYWRESTIGYAGHAWWTYVNGSKVDSWGEWRADLAGGRYEVFVWVPRANASTAKAPYTVYYVGGQVTKVVNQGAYHDQWVSLGTYAFFDGRNLQVRLTDATGELINSRTIAFDAVRFVPR